MNTRLYLDLEEAKIKLTFWKNKELEFRNEVLEEMASSKDEGVVKKTVDDLLIESTYKLRRKIDISGLDSIRKELSDEEKECIVYKPFLVMKNYKKLEETGESKLLDVVQIIPAQGTVQIKHL